MCAYVGCGVEARGTIASEFQSIPPICHQPNHDRCHYRYRCVRRVSVLRLGFKQTDTDCQCAVGRGGFGLKNIIDNVSSGVVLLFERSIRVGDWVVVGTTAGLVTKINIRSTVIQTWDEADVIVPNADLITAQVTNWTLTKSSGRIRIPLGLAYGTDTDWVRSLLLDIANAHPEIITDGSTPKPIVLFFGFGESALRFELRCFVKDIMQQLTVVSELNLAIARKLREHGVEVPYPQRELHIKSWTQRHGSEGGALAPR